jgi:signal transduction histidine kinase
MHKQGRINDLEFHEPSPPLFFSKLIHVAAKELTENACKFSEMGTPISVCISAENRGHTISITNQTMHTTADTLNKYRLFEQHQRNIAEQQGLGIGLAISKLIAGLHKGNIEFIEIENYTPIRTIQAVLILPNS